MLILFVIAACVGSTECRAQNKPLPRFEDFPITEKFKGEPAPVKIVGSNARMFRTMLRRKAAQGPNFAGHYTVATRGCGSDCKGLAIVDARTGEIYYVPKTLSILRAPFQEEESIQFRLDSRLLIVAGTRLDDRNDNGEGKYFYEWKSNRFRLLRTVKNVRTGQVPL
jgi:hypothetical protein